jgi:hypothetical protein
MKFSQKQQQKYILLQESLFLFISQYNLREV